MAEEELLADRSSSEARSHCAEVASHPRALALPVHLRLALPVPSTCLGTSALAGTSGRPLPLGMGFWNWLAAYVKEEDGVVLLGPGMAYAAVFFKDKGTHDGRTGGTDVGWIS